MGRKWRYVIWVYVAGAVVTVVLCVLNAYGNGGFQRHHGVMDLLTIAAIYLAAAILWPVLIAWAILLYFGLAPDTITI